MKTLLAIFVTIATCAIIVGALYILEGTDVYNTYLTCHPSETVTCQPKM